MVPVGSFFQVKGYKIGIGGRENSDSVFVQTKI